MCKLLQRMLGDALNRNYVKLDVYRDGDFVVITTMDIKPEDELYFEFKYNAVLFVGVDATIQFILACRKAGINEYKSGTSYSL